MTIHIAQNSLKQTLTKPYGAQEASNIANLVLEKITGLSRIDRLINKETELDALQISLLQKYTQQLIQNRPVQYVLGEADFAGLSFLVDESVLIPRPETEELVSWVVETLGQRNVDILDVGTGSGCIAVALKSKLSNAQISAIDISLNALNMAEKNALRNHTKVNFFRVDILEETAWKDLDEFDCIISNPPYIALNEKESMAANVLNYEPHSALFVTNSEPLVFYKKIAQFAKLHLKNDGRLFFEINENFGEEIVGLLQTIGFQNVEIKRDLQGKDRMVNCLFKK
ncbi:peptide chain release factor N(5)-glutamine methyltransferase [Arachidicoccus sp.]|jgi:release factor glutamine methyltransferase|uniref:peptide chain release factor N(5)-glutamine methyltransferase n=1 Tax=Arachidicoccus sp. TaxID=1872624 RepID=UPI003D259166